MKWLLFLSLIAFAISNPAWAHCQIPCGIFEDNLRFELMKEHITTIEKSMLEIQKLSQQQPIDYNQLVRWIQNKEQHASELSHILTYYFLDQRIKPVPADQPEYFLYVQKLVVVHKMLIHTMKTKQTTDLTHIEALRKLWANFKELYFGPINPEEHKHDGTGTEHKH